MGFFRTYKRIAAILYWEGLKSDVQQFVAYCEVCQSKKRQAMSPAGLLQPLPIPNQVWEDISMDFIEGLLKVQGIDTILVVVDRLTKYSHFLPLKHSFTAKEVADCFIREVVRLHGYPQSIVWDRDKVFLSNFWTKLFKQVGTTLNFSAAYHPESDGQT